MPIEPTLFEPTPAHPPAPNVVQSAMPPLRLAGTVAACLVVLGLALTLIAGGTRAQSLPPGDPYAGLWFDDTGQGAVQIEPCGGQLCGKIAWLKSPKDERGRVLTDANNPDPKRRSQPICGLPVIGGLKPQSGGIWDEGWIYDPKVGKSYDVELKLRSLSVLQVTGYLGVKFLGESFLWKRAPDDLLRCASLPLPGAPRQR